MKQYMDLLEINSIEKIDNFKNQNFSGIKNCKSNEEKNV